MFPVCLPLQLSPFRGKGAWVVTFQIPSVIGQALFLGDFASLAFLVCHVDTVGTGGQRRPSGRFPCAGTWEWEGGKEDMGGSTSASATHATHLA